MARIWTGSEWRTRTALLVVGAALLSGIATALIVLIPRLHFAYREDDLHVAVETAAALIALLAAYLLFGRFRRRRRLDDLLLCYSLAVLGVANLAFAVAPAVSGVSSASRFATWAALSGRLLGTAIFAAAAFAPHRRVGRNRARGALIAVSLPVVLGILAGTIALLETRLPLGVQTILPQTSGRPRLVGDPGLLAVQIARMTLFSLAAVGFLRRATRESDEFARWLSLAAVFGAFAGLNYFLYPSLYTEWVYTGDVFRLISHVAILVAAAREISSYWAQIARVAALEERRRLVRELHDGLAQELAFITRNLQRLDRDEPIVARLAASAQRALAESRLAISTWTGSLDGPLDRALAQAARETAEREGTSVALDLAPNVELDAERREALIRITCEAIANAARHGHASLVRIELENGRRVALRISDEGSGFDPASLSPATETSFGIVSMRERAAAIGGRFRLTSAPGDGTTVEVML